MSFNYKFLKRKIKYKNFSLENLNNFDIEKIRIWRNSQRKVLRQNNIISKKKQISYFNNYILDQTKKKFPEVILFGFKKDGILIGYGGLVYISWENKRAELSYLLKTELNKNQKIYENYSTKYFKLAKKFAFERLKLNRLYTETFIYRKKHMINLESSGFKKEGVLRKHNIKNNKTINVIVHSIIK